LVNPVNVNGPLPWSAVQHAEADRGAGIDAKKPSK
jgi:hypothetical protein